MVDYSKWKDIEISDDEDETHPNIDTPSLFRWRHQARVERMEERRREREELEAAKAAHEKKVREAKEKVTEAEKLGVENLNELRVALKELETQAEEIKKKEEDFKKKEKITPWNVDTISHSGFTKTVINRAPQRPDEELSEEEREQRMKKFVKENEKKLKEFGMLRRFEDSKRYLMENQQLVAEDTANYLVIWCINLEMEQKHDLMEHVAHQCICMQYILELSKQLNVDPRACVSSFFSRIQVAEPEYKNSFQDELNSFKERIRKRAAEKLQEAMREAEEEERQARLGPGGLDPVEVFDSLPDELKKCFESQDIPLLQETIAKMPEEEARYHMKRCVDSGLWVPDAKKQEKSEEPETETQCEATD
ncbi:hsp90 co-chaperone Cdc37 [Anabrus simplex]|uniref:hsp90 co-chaperone Cdc37 n=1 Tax=Anabrus simplex TaxID=316456 RepID=UPI0034DCCA1A